VIVTVANMEQKNDLPSGEAHLRVADMELSYGQHYELTPNGIVLLKSGHHRIHLHLLQSADLGESAAAVIESVLENADFSEDTFSHRHKPASIFRAVSTRSMRFIPDAYKEELRRRLLDSDPPMARRVSKLLIHIYETAVSYPDVETLLHCYFRAEWLTPDKFTLYVRSRLMRIEDKAGLDKEYYVIKSEMDQFVQNFDPVLATTGLSKNLTEEEFSEAMEVLYEKLSNQYRLRSVNCRKKDIKRTA
jgi:hypothetical protein